MNTAPVGDDPVLSKTLWVDAIKIAARPNSIRGFVVNRNHHFVPNLHRVRAHWHATSPFTNGHHVNEGRQRIDQHFAGRAGAAAGQNNHPVKAEPLDTLAVLGYHGAGKQCLRRAEVSRNQSGGYIQIPVILILQISQQSLIFLGNRTLPWWCGRYRGLRRGWTAVFVTAAEDNHAQAKTDETQEQLSYC